MRSYRSLDSTLLGCTTDSGLARYDDRAPRDGRPETFEPDCAAWTTERKAGSSLSPPAHEPPGLSTHAGSQAR